MGPCLCGDYLCPSCGDPGRAVIEAAEEWAMGTLNKAKLSPEEYKIAVSVGLAAVHHARAASKQTAAIIAANQAEIEADKRIAEYFNALT